MMVLLACAFSFVSRSHSPMSCPANISASRAGGSLRSSRASGFLESIVGSGKGNNHKLKAGILELAQKTKRGLVETEEEREKMLMMFEKLEKLNPTKSPLASPKTSGKWLLKYTTSDSILGRGGSERVGEIVQVLDIQGLKASNAETRKLFGLFNLPVKVKAELTPTTSSLCAVQFKQFIFGGEKGLKFPAPESFKGSLDITYVDEDLRLSRGDKGNIFVLVKESDDTSL